MKERIDSVSWQTSKCRNGWCALYWSHEPVILMSSRTFLASVYQDLQMRSSGPGPTLIIIIVFSCSCCIVTFPLGFWDSCHFILNYFYLLGFSSEWGRLQGMPFKQYGVFALAVTTTMTTMTMKNHCDRERHRREPSCHSHSVGSMAFCGQFT